MVVRVYDYPKMAEAEIRVGYHFAYPHPKSRQA